ncbi:MAG: hypothetical protein ACHQ53_15835, partial [Polyangiales bacterium]
MTLQAACGTQGAGSGYPDELAHPGYPSAPPARDAGVQSQPATIAVDAGTRIVPTDDRPVRHSSLPALPISGGTLLVTADDAWAVAADPERDRISIVDLRTEVLARNIELMPGDEPGRIIEDDMHRVHVALRRGGAVVTLDPASGKILDRRSVCAAPRGIAFDGSTRVLRVACNTGELVTLPVDGGTASSKVMLGPDLRDVIAGDLGTFVTHFKRAELLRLDPAGQPESVQTPPPVNDAFVEGVGAKVLELLDADMAWRTRQDPVGGSIYMAHEGAREGEIDIGAATGPSLLSPTSNPYGAVGDTCAGVVQTELSTFDASGQFVATVRLNAVLAVDVAAMRGTVAVAEAGARDPEQPMVTFAIGGPVSGLAVPGFVGPGPGGVMPAAAASSSGRVLVYDQSAVVGGSGGCVSPRMTIERAGQTVAVALTSDGRLVAQSREPASLWIATVDAPSADDAGVGSDVAVVNLGGDSVYDTGHELFHRAPGAGLACASCHGEGAEDGHVWVFSGQGQRRTQAVHVGLAGTEPFHWDGELADMGALMEEVMVSRMGGVHQSIDRSNALQDWLFSIKAPAPLRAADDASALRGKQLFQGAGGCTQCHSGAKLTNNQTIDVGTGKA